MPPKPWLALWRVAELAEWRDPNTHVRPCPPFLQDSESPPAPETQGVVSEPNGLLLPPVHNLVTIVEDLI